MFTYDFEEKLKKKIIKISKKDKVLAINFKKKVLEIISKDSSSINTYKNLKSPQNNLKRIHLTDNFILLFKVSIKENHILFVDLAHWDKAYKR